jgi:mono/diheme cytochrome c family protein
LARPFDAVSGVVGRPTSWPRAEARLLVEPGNARNSFLIDKLVRQNLVPELEGDAMPLELPRLGGEALTVIRRWISDGALDDATYRGEVAPVFAASCNYCHGPNSGQEPDLTQPFDPVVGVVNVAAGSRVRVVPGDPDASSLVMSIEGKPAGGVPMPFHPERVTQAELTALIRWIAAGALDN